MKLIWLSILFLWTSNLNAKRSPAKLSSKRRSTLPTRRSNSDVGKPLGPRDFRNADRLASDAFAVDRSVMYNSGKFQGDIVRPVRHRNALSNRDQRWPEGRIPYTISNLYTEKDRAIIARAMKTYHTKTCIKFVKKEPNDRYYIKIMPDSGCFSAVGRVTEEQPVSLGQGCVYVPIVEHELMHAVGFWHEQSRSDRDKYVKIHWKNIKKDMKYNFQKMPREEIDFLGEKYDYGSVMHYGSKAFSSNNEQTIEPKKEGVKIGVAKTLSKVDLRKINKLYGCSKKEGSAPALGRQSSRWTSRRPTASLKKSTFRRSTRRTTRRHKVSTIKTSRRTTRRTTKRPSARPKSRRPSKRPSIRSSIRSTTRRTTKLARRTTGRPSVRFSTRKITRSTRPGNGK